MKIWLFLLGMAVIAPVRGQQVSSILLEENVEMDGLIQGPDRALYCGGGWNRSQIHRITQDGSRSVHASGLGGPIQPVFGEEDTLYVTNWSGNSLSTVSPEGDVLDTRPAGTGPHGLLRLENGDLLVSRNPVSSAGDIRRLRPDGSQEIWASGGSINRPGGMVRDAEGFVYAGNVYDGQITRISPDGTHEPFATIPSVGQYKIGQMALAGGFIYATALSGHRVYRVSPDGEVEVFAGTGTQGQLDGPALEARFRHPNGICASSEGDTLFVIETLASTDRVRVITGLEQVSVSGRNDNTLPGVIELLPAAPNPFNPATRIRWRQATPGEIRLLVYDISGGLRMNVIRDQGAGEHSLHLDAGAWPGGLYLVHLVHASGLGETQKVLLLK